MLPANEEKSEKMEWNDKEELLATSLIYVESPSQIPDSVIDVIAHYDS